MRCPEPDRWSELADPTRRDELEVHLDACDDCRELVAAIASVGSGSAAVMAPELATSGSMIGRYTVEGPIGAGGMGIVLAARDPQLERTVALKLVRVVDRSAAAIASARTRLVAEGKAMARVAHPNIVGVHEVVEADDELFIAMERVDGCDLAGWLDTPRTRAERLRVVVEIGRGLAAAHAAGLVHRDIKPANVLIGSDGRARITDFGLASAVAAPDVVGGAASRLVGTVGYLAPEVAAGARGDARSDQYAFAITAWQTLFGARPETRPQRGPHARVLRRALAEAPGDRFPSVAALTDRLARAGRTRWPRYVVAALVVGALAFAWWRTPAAADCEADPTVGGTWTTPRRALLLTALRDRSPGRQLAPRVAELIDVRARAWSDAVVDTCTVRRRGTESPALADRRGACLEDQRRQLDALLVALGHTSASRALAAVAQLPSADACAAPPPLPVADDPVHRAARAELVAVAALRAAGRYDEAATRLTALARTAPTDDPALAASIAYLRADLVMRAGDAKAALPLVNEAVAIAERAHDDANRYRAMIVLVAVLDELGRANETRALLPLLEAASARQTLGDDDIATLENTLGNADHTAGAYADAERHYRAALAASEREYGGIDSPELAGALADLGAALHNQAKVGEARELLSRSVAMYERTVGPAHPDIAIPLTELGSLAAEADDLDTAAADYERVIAIRTAALGADHPYLCEPTAMLGTVEHRRGHDDRALVLARRSLAIAEHGFGPDHPLAAVAQGHIAELLVDRTSASRCDAARPGKAGACDRGERDEAERLAEASVKTWDASGAALPDAYDARFLLARLVWDDGAHDRARALAETARAGYAALAPPYNKTATRIADWLATHRADRR